MAELTGLRDQCCICGTSRSPLSLTVDNRWACPKHYDRDEMAVVESDVAEDQENY